MIPVMIVPILSRPELIHKMIASIDYPVDRLLVIDNGDVVYGEGVPDWDVPGHGPASSVRIIRPGGNLGVGASWNLGIKATVKSPWWMVVNFDLEFGPGDLANMVELMDVKTPRVAYYDEWGFAAFAVNTKALDRIGLFDENLHPAYFEDNDFVWRAKLAKVEVVTRPSGIRHVGSATIKGNADYNRQNGSTFKDNKSYYIAKWGGGPGHEVFETPFDLRRSEPGITFSRIRDLAWDPPKDVR